METVGKNHMPSCQNFWELCNLVFLGVAAQTESVFKGGEIVPGKIILKHVSWSFGPCIKGFAMCKPIIQVDDTWLHRKYTGTLLIAIAQDEVNYIFPIAYAIVEGETTSTWGFF